MLYAFYSYTADQYGVGLNLYHHPDGREVLVTRVDDNPGLTTKWHDEKFLGPVSGWVRIVRASRFKDIERSPGMQRFETREVAG